MRHYEGFEGVTLRGDLVLSLLGQRRALWMSLCHQEFGEPIELVAAHPEGAEELTSLVAKFSRETEASGAIDLASGYELVEFGNQSGHFSFEVGEEEITVTADPILVLDGYYRAVAKLLLRPTVAKWFELSLAPYGQYPESDVALLLISPRIADEVFGDLRRIAEDALRDVPRLQGLSFETYGQPWADLAQIAQQAWWERRQNTSPDR